MGSTGYLYSLGLLGNLMELLVHNLLSLAIAEVDMAIVIWTSVVLVPSLDRLAPKLLKLICSSSLLPSTH
ncbi:hypothetical protein DPMN_188768 [Dreissena polymorpha]|uniref:Uncharacterized protein n=1 Tax=Dreissena polymorpha TaxID=45954 RepID=A0A9D4IBM6_DREPO|nr:hypothetical protein DPMN_188706 [Dreissena polymorpha]KAH3754107.1 hypothetical protein DPMN_188768 [Dreissena polymorpha]